MPTFKTKSGETVSFRTGRKKKKSGMSPANRRAAKRRAKSMDRIKTGPNKGQFKKKGR